MAASISGYIFIFGGHWKIMSYKPVHILSCKRKTKDSETYVLCAQILA